MKAFGGEDTIPGKAGPCYIACGLAVASVLVAAFCLPNLGQECLEEEDRKFRRILEMHGYRTETMGLSTSRHEEYSLGKFSPSSGSTEIA
jgi:hypothetical protein